METRKVSDIVFRDDLYPRIETSAVTVQKYAEDLAVLPPIEVNQQNELVDGWHRWTAHKKNEAEDIAVTVTPTKSDAHLLELAIERNAAHGLQLSQQDKRDMARRIYHVTAEKERDAKKKHLAKILSVSERTVRDWLSRIDKDTKEARNRRIFDLWLAGWTEREIADAVGASAGDVHKVCSEMADLPNLSKPDQSAASSTCGWEIPEIWEFAPRPPRRSVNVKKFHICPSSYPPPTSSPHLAPACVGEPLLTRPPGSARMVGVTSP